MSVLGGNSLGISVIFHRDILAKNGATDHPTKTMCLYMFWFGWVVIQQDLIYVMAAIFVPKNNGSLSPFRLLL